MTESPRSESLPDHVRPRARLRRPRPPGLRLALDRDDGGGAPATAAAGVQLQPRANGAGQRRAGRRDQAVLQDLSAFQRTPHGQRDCRPRPHDQGFSRGGAVGGRVPRPAGGPRPPSPRRLRNRHPDPLPPQREAGARLESRVAWDNSAASASNPEVPPARVRWGLQSFDEMGSIDLFVVPEGDRKEADAAMGLLRVA